MSITYVSKQKYLELVNEEIRKHHMYKDGMCAEFAQGADAESATGLRCGPNTPQKYWRMQRILFNVYTCGYSDLTLFLKIRTPQIHAKRIFKERVMVWVG